MVPSKPPGELLILIVDDDDDDAREGLTQFLGLNGYGSSQAKNGQEALEQLQASAHPPQLILLDLDMPVMDGREFLSRLPSISGTLQPAVIVITRQALPTSES